MSPLSYLRPHPVCRIQDIPQYVGEYNHTQPYPWINRGILHCSKQQGAHGQWSPKSMWPLWYLWYPKFRRNIGHNYLKLATFEDTFIMFWQFLKHQMSIFLRLSQLSPSFQPKPSLRPSASVASASSARRTSTPKWPPPAPPADGLAQANLYRHPVEEILHHFRDGWNPKNNGTNHRFQLVQDFATIGEHVKGSLWDHGNFQHLTNHFS